jgi:hypothetical protein
MTDSTFDHRKKHLRDFLLIISGAVLVLFLTSFGTALVLYLGGHFSATPSFYMPITGWFGI